MATSFLWPDGRRLGAAPRRGWRAVAALALSAVVACQSAGSPDDPPAAVDWDGDGFETGEDCDDFSSAVHPGASEWCDGYDDDCDGDVDEDAADATPFHPDLDGDGYGDPSSTLAACAAPAGYVDDAADCNDGAADVHPGAAETCDGVDQDCDGEVDEEVAGAPSWYADGDGDGYGDVSRPTFACAAPPGTVDDSTDCDDDEAGVHPGEAETCDGIDQDCDGEVDEDAADMGLEYTDADGDGYGDPATGTPSCAPGPGAVADGSDCDDLDPSAHPGAVEACDGLDQDCDGESDEDFDLDEDGVTTCDGDCDDAEGAVFPGAIETCDSTDEDCDGAVDEGYDSDADGATVCAGDCDDADPGVGPGARERCNGRDDDCDGAPERCGPAGTSWVEDADVTIAPLSAYTFMGEASAVGDVDMDGHTDLFLGAPGYITTSRGDAYLFYGPIDADRYAAGADAVLDGGDPVRGAGSAVGIADMTGDGVPDLVVGAAGTLDDGENNGAVFVVPGPALGAVDLLASAVAAVWGDGYDAELGTYLSVAGDVTGDGFADLVVTGERDAWLFPGPLAGDSTSWDARTTWDLEDGDSARVVIADVDGDDQGDVVLASGDKPPTGAVAIFLGPLPAGDVAWRDADVILTAAEEQEAFGASISASDVDGDGVVDLLVGAPEAETVGPTSGAAYLFLGPQVVDRTSAEAEVRFLPEGSDDWLGESVAAAGDVNGDGFGDVAVGARGIHGVYLAYGPFAGDVLLGRYGARALSYDDSSQMAALLDVPADLDGDGYDDLATLDQYSYVGGTAYLCLGGPREDLDEDGYDVASGDCDDRDPRVHPSAAEACDGVDSDCDGTADPDPATDADGDGVGPCDGDCDDGDPSVHPGQPETCDNGLDDDCDGAADGCGPMGEVAAEAADAVLLGARPGDEAGTALAAGGDVDGDGFPDLVVGAPGHSEEGPRAGAAFLVRGPMADTRRLTHAEATLLGEAEGDEAGTAVAGVGDVDGDGYDDFLVGAPSSDAAGTLAGAAYLVTGPVTGTLSLATATARFRGEDAYHVAGIAVAGLGDVDGDGLPDFAIVASNSGYLSPGRVYVFTHPVSGDVPLSDADALILDGAGRGTPGFSVAAVGDVTGDGSADVMVGAPGGIAGNYVFPGPLSGTLHDSAATATLSALHSNDEAGAVIAGAGDVDGDGTSDVLLSAPGFPWHGYDRDGVVYLLLGPVSGDILLSRWGALYVHPEPRAQLGAALATGGDADGDGVPEVLMGAPGVGTAHLLGTSSTGEVWLDREGTTLRGGSRFGSAVAFLPDMDGDGDDEVVVSDPGDDAAGADSGTVFVFRGGPGW